jgi:coenzyme PQQ precursor peptide PqqA
MLRCSNIFIAMHKHCIARREIVLWRRRRSRAAGYLLIRISCFARARRRPPKQAAIPHKPHWRKIMTEVTWTAPEACEICVGMEVTSYMSAAL